MAPNPRIDDLRKRLEREPGSRLFAQLAEELRKDGALEEAIRICREGLQKNPAYPSAHMTLGRALFDKGELESAREEFESVLKGAPDNILASRLLGECLEGLGDIPGARSRYQATLLLSPGDRQVGSRLEGLKPGAAPVSTAPGLGARPASAAGPGAPPAPRPAAPLAARAAEPEAPPPEPPPIPLAVVDEPMELESSHERMLTPAIPATGSPSAEAAGAGDDEPPPIPLSEAEEFFELEAAYEAPVPHEVGGAGAVAPIEPAEEFEFDLEPTSSTMPVPVVRSEALSAPEPELAPAPPMAMAVPAPEASPLPEIASGDTEGPSEAAAASGPSAGPAPGPEIASTTLAELYFVQGFREKAADVYRQLLEREPDNEEARSRLREIAPPDAAAGAAPPAPSAPPGPGSVEARRVALQRTILGLENLLRVVRRHPE